MTSDNCRIDYSAPYHRYFIKPLVTTVKYSDGF